jgi:hypothetical protein
METDGTGSRSSVVVDFRTTCANPSDSTSRMLFILSNSNGSDRVKQKTLVCNQHHTFLNAWL